MHETLKILILEPYEQEYILLRKYLEQIPEHACNIDRITTWQFGLRAMQQQHYDICIADTSANPDSQLAILRTANDLLFPTPIIIIADRDTRHINREAIQAGAADYLTWDMLSPLMLERTILFALDRIRLNQESRLNQEKNRIFFDTAPCLLFNYKPDGTIIDINNRVEQLLGYKREELLGKSLASILPPNEWQRVRKVIKSLKQGDSTMNNEYTLFRKDGSTLEISVNSTPIFDQQNECTAILSIVSDISRYKQNLTEMRKAKKEAEDARMELENLNQQLEMSIKSANMMARQALKANQAKSNFFATISHELRTPISGILGFAELLSQESLTNTQKEYVDTILLCGKGLLNLVNDILDYSKIEAGKFSIEIADCPLNKTIQDIVQLMRPLAAKKNITLESRYLTSIPAVIKTDPDRLRQCLINLVGNAIKFTEKGFVRIEVAWDDSDYMAPLNFNIIDTGIGIPQDKQQIIFELFTQADSGTTRKYGGTGLGLAITKQLVTMLKGTLTVTSKPNEGATFTIKLPTGLDKDSVQLWQDNPESDATVECNPKTAPTEPAQLNGRILVAEDNPQNARLLEVILKQLGLETYIAQNGRVALDMLQSLKIDLILMDIQMPIMNGFEATREIRKRNPSLPIIALTANAQKEYMDKCLQGGFTDFLTKPIQQTQLTEKLLHYLSHIERHKETDPKTGKQETSLPRTDTSPKVPIVSKLSQDEELAEIAEMFIQSLPDMMTKITQALEKSNLDELVRLGHELKGAGGSAGFDILFEKGLELENAAKKTNNEMIQAIISELNSLIPRLRSHST